MLCHIFISFTKLDTMLKTLNWFEYLMSHGFSAIRVHSKAANNRVIPVFSSSQSVQRDATQIFITYSQKTILDRKYVRSIVLFVSFTTI